jgi:catechol 2,3-dioxygenase-like lactoylglutathione lyase family enzyme
MANLTWMGVCLDCADARELADFYVRLLGWEVRGGDGAGWISIGDPAETVHLNFQAEEWYQRPVWPERADAPQKMMHFEILVEDMDAAVAHAIAAGATMADPQPADRDPTQLRVMLDPAGHPFCLCTD